MPVDLSVDLPADLEVGPPVDLTEDPEDLSVVCNCGHLYPVIVMVSSVSFPLLFKSWI